MLTVNAESYVEAEGGIGKVSVRRIFRYVLIDTDPRRSPSACSETLVKKYMRNPRLMATILANKFAAFWRCQHSLTILRQLRRWAGMPRLKRRPRMRTHRVVWIQTP